MTTTIPFDLLKQQNAETSNALMDFFSNSPEFQQLALREGTLTVNRDKEDDAKLALGIAHAQDKGVLDKSYKPEPYHSIDVLGKTPTQVAKEVLNSIQQESSNDDSSGFVIVMCGLSGTGKGTTVETLRKMLEAQGKQVVSWSNGNVFRSVTLLAATWCEQEGQDNIKAALTKENLASFMKMLSFDKFHGKYDICINGLGLDHVLVSDIQNTTLKGPKVSKNIPTVAQVTQGEVILFAAEAIGIMTQTPGLVVLLEGREQTVNYVRTPHRFTLKLSDESLIGKRRAAQRLMAATCADLKSTTTTTNIDNDAVAKALNENLLKMVSEIEE